LNIPQGGNDGKTLLAALQQASNCDAAVAQPSSDDSSAAAGVVEVLSKLRGPWSLFYWQEQQQTLWFARDVMGKFWVPRQHMVICDVCIFTSSAERILLSARDCMTHEVQICAAALVMLPLSSSHAMCM
jgi:hypothetical protein